ARPPVESGCHPQLRAVRDAGEAGRDSGDVDPRMVHPESDRRVRDRLFAAVRPRALPHARLREHSERGRLPEVDGRSAQGAATGSGADDAVGPVITWYTGDHLEITWWIRATALGRRRARRRGGRQDPPPSRLPRPTQGF